MTEQHRKRMIAVVALVTLTLVGTFVWWMCDDGVPGEVVLKLDLRRGLAEALPIGALGRAMVGRRARVRTVVDALNKAADDKRVVALAARIGGRHSMARVQEVRDAIQAFHAKGKPTFAYAETVGGPGGAGNVLYYLASAFDKIYVQPSGNVAFQGLAFESTFLRGCFDKAGVVPRMDHRKEYKNMKNIFTEKAFTPAHREATARMAASLWDQIVEGVAKARKLSPAMVRSLADKGPLSAKEALDGHLIDGLAYHDEVITHIEKKVGKDVPFLSLGKYLARVGRPHKNKKGTRIALVYAVGGVRRGKSRYDPMMGSMVMGSDTVSEALRKAIDDKKVKAIVIRVDSPGGSYVASDTIWREVVRARKKGKVVIASMGRVAASGGYFVAMAADKIVAQPATLTGSIGVLSGKMVAAKLLRRFGLSWDEVHTSTNARLWSIVDDFTPAQWKRFQSELDRIYADFTAKVGQGRKLPPAKVEEIARGRVWTGADAKERGLVDALGGLETALALARKGLKLPADAPLEIRVLPRRKSSFAKTMIRRFLVEAPEPSEMGSTAAEAMEALRPVTAIVRHLRWTATPGALRMEEYREAR